MNIAEQISAFEAKRATLVAANSGIMEKAAGEGATLDAEQSEAFDGNEADITAIDKHLERLRKMEKAAAATAAPVQGKTAADAAGSRTGTTIIVKGDANEAFEGQNYTRMVIAKTLARLDGISAEGIANQRWGKSNPQLVQVIKAAVAGGGTESGEWGAELAQADTRYTGDFIDFLYAQTIFDNLPLREVPANVHIKGQDGAATAYWVGQSKSIPVTKADFSDVTLSRLKVAAIAVISKELLQDSSPSAELLVRDALVNASAQRVDQTFLSDAAAVANISPAGILNGLTAGTSAGNDIADVITDVKALYAPFIAANNATGLQFVTTETLAKSLGLMQNPLAGRHLDGMFMLFPTDGLPVAAAVSDHQDKRLAAKLETALQHFHHAAIGMLVNLIAKREVRTRTRAGLLRLPRDGLEERTRAEMVNIILFAFAAAEAEPLFQGGRLLDHLDGIAEQDACLRLRGAGRVYLRASFLVGNETVEADAARERRLAVALALLDVGPPKPTPPAVLRAVELPAEQGPDNERLRRVRPEGLVIELAFAELQLLFEEAQRARRLVSIEPQPSLVTLFEVVEMAATGVADMGPGDDLPGDYGLGIGGCPVSRAGRRALLRRRHIRSSSCQRARRRACSRWSGAASFCLRRHRRPTG